jgi:hypothetical protein
MNGPERERMRRWERELAEEKARVPRPEPAQPDTPAGRAVTTLMREGRGRGRRSPSGMPPIDYDYLVRATVSKDGEDVIVRLTPTQALRFVDMIYEAED